MKKNILKGLATALCALAVSSCAPSQPAETQQASDAAKNSEAVIENIMTRTSIRAYTDQAVPAETVETLLRAGMAAPTAVNAQPWHFIAIDSREKIAQLAEAMPRVKMLQQAPLAIVVCGDLNKTVDGAGREFWIQDCSAATENILLAAHALGLGAVWTAGYPMEDRVAPLRATLDLPESIVPLCTIVIGYPDQQPAPKDKWKPENVSYNTFGGVRD